MEDWARSFNAELSSFSPASELALGGLHESLLPMWAMAWLFLRFLDTANRQKSWSWRDVM